jgi:N-methylhydantoinase A
MPGHQAPVALIERSALAPGDVVCGPALIVEEVSTTWLSAGWNCHVDPWGNLLLERHPGA